MRILISSGGVEDTYKFKRQSSPLKNVCLQHFGRLVSELKQIESIFKRGLEQVPGSTRTC